MACPRFRNNGRVMTWHANVLEVAPGPGKPHMYCIVACLHVSCPSFCFPLGRHLNLASKRSGSNIAGEQRRPGCRKAKTRARNAEACNSAVHMGFSRARRHFQNVGMPCHHPTVISKTRACHVITRSLFLKRGRATSSLGRYFQNGRRGPF